MTARRLPRMSTSRYDRGRGSREHRSWMERVLHGLGAHPTFTDAVLGDLAEERARRTAEGAPMAARWWYAREAFRSTPHLLWNAVWHGGRRGQVRAAAVLAALSVVPLAALLTLHLRDGPPARLVVGAGDAVDGLILNSVRPVRLSVQVLDATGHALQSTGVRYRWESGTPASVTPAGVVTCTQRGDATLRAWLGAVATSIRLRCRPVHDVRAPAMLDVIIGGRSRDVPFEALDADGRRVTLLAGQIAVGDSTVLSLTGSRIRGRKAGSTWVTVRMGDRDSFSSVHVYERVPTPERIRPGQHLAVPVRLMGGEMRRWRIPAGFYFLAMVPDGDEQATPRLAVVDANCTRAVGHLLCAARNEAFVIAYYPQGVDSAQVLRGALAIWRQDDP